MDLDHGVFPACAGMIPKPAPSPSTDFGVPRMRGDDPKARTPLVPTLECSPHARG